MNENWNYIKFKDLIVWSEKSKIKSGDGQQVGKYKLYVCSDSEIKRYDEGIEEGEALIFGTGGKPSCHFEREKFAYSTDCVVAKAKADNIDLKFYYYYFRQNNMGMIQETFSGSGLQHTSKKKIGDILVPLIPFEEQTKIVCLIEDYLSQLDEGWKIIKFIKQKLSIYKEAVLKNAFSYEANVVKKTIIELCENIVDCPHSTPKWTTEGRLCLRTTNFKRGYLDLSEKNYVSEDTYNERIRRLKPEAGDVLYSREGAILGIACMIPEGLEICMGQRMMLLRTKACLNNKYLMHYLNSPLAKELVVHNIGGSASPHINVGDIKKFPIPFVNIEEQLKVVSGIESRLSVCDNLEKIIDESLLQTEALKQSVLKKAFEGRLV